MLTEQEKKLLTEADALAKATAPCGLENYLTPEARNRIKGHPSRAAWAIHFHTELCRENQTSITTLDIALLDRAFRLADVVVAQEVLGQKAFDYAAYLADRKLKEEFVQVVHRYRGRQIDPAIKTVILKMAREICARQQSAYEAAA